MKPSDFDLQSGVASVSWVLEVTADPVDPGRNHLREDLVQFVLDRGTIVDVGWYPELSTDGCFKVFVVVDQDWTTPKRVAECGTLAELERVFRECLDWAKALEKAK